MTVKPVQPVPPTNDAQKHQHELEQKNQELHGTRAQLEAHKQICNEQLGVNVQLRTNLILFQQELQKKNQELEKANAQIKLLSQQLGDATARIAALTPKPAEAPPAGDAA
jgi:septal ring factor EnvC (AmiA/AmiB activator)